MTTSPLRTLVSSLALASTLWAASPASAQATPVNAPAVCAPLYDVIVSAPASLTNPVVVYAGKFRAPLAALAQRLGGFATWFSTASLATNNSPLSSTLAAMATSLTHSSAALDAGLAAPTSLSGTKTFNKDLAVAATQYETFVGLWTPFATQLQSTSAVGPASSYLASCAVYNTAAYQAVGIVNDAEARAKSATPKGQIFSGATTANLLAVTKDNPHYQILSGILAPNQPAVVKMIVTSLKRPQPRPIYAPLTSSLQVCVAVTPPATLLAVNCP